MAFCWAIFRALVEMSVAVICVFELSSRANVMAMMPEPVPTSKIAVVAELSSPGHPDRFSVSGIAELLFLFL